jgi:eukaryotic-like serine/threonine-protein kinase
MTAEFTTGQHIGDYEILSILGLGGMGKVYKVRNLISDRVEAMKILLPDLTSQQSLADRFLREIRLLATLEHPNIAALRTALTYENQLVMIMEFVEGETLANRLARAPISTAEAVNYSDQILSALSYAHKQNIIHRDIKPANIMLTPQGLVKLMDFGIARSSSDGALTTTGTTLGSLNYMPPEQVRGEAADARSDIYSYGVSMYEMLTGKLPFRGDSQYSLMTAHLNTEPPSPISLRCDLPPALNEIILMAMAKEPGNRFQTADAFRNALKSVPVSALSSSGTTVTPTPQAKPGTMTTLVETPIPARVSTVATPPPPPPVAPAITPAPRPATVAAAPPSVPPHAPAAAPSRRGLWLAIGTLLGVGIVVAAGIYVPRHLRTHADPEKAMVPADTKEAPNPAASSSENPAATAVAIQSDKGSVTVDGQGNVSVETPKGNVEVSGTSGSVKISAGNPKPLRNAGTTAVAPPGIPAGPSPEELAKLEDDADKLNVRAATASHSVDTLRQQQAASGYNLRADIAAAQERMQLYLAKGNAALKAKDTAGAQKYFDLADAEISKVEKFLGH